MSINDHIAEHRPEAVRSRLEAGKRHSYLRDFIYGAVDGAVTTFAVVSGVAGAGLGSGVVIILGLANLVGDGFSMAAGNYLGVKAEEQQRSHARSTEARQIDAYPEGERQEIREIFRRKGFEGDDLERVVEVITSSRERWIDTMLTEEFGLTLEGPNPWRAGWVTFVAFLLVGLVPLAPFLVAWLWPALGLVGGGPTFAMSAVLTGVAFFAVGANKSRFVEGHWAYAGLETLAVGGAAAALAYFIGMLLRGVAA